jgi:hypothetical protein
MGPPYAMQDSKSPTLAPEDMWKRVGFMQHAYEFWLLANLIVERVLLVKMPVDSPDPDPDQNDRGAIIEPVLHRYNQYNMQQVNDLISSFENARIM